LLDYEHSALIHKYFGASLQYMLNEIPCDLFYILLAVALDLDERDRHLRYLLAGGDPKEWNWSSTDRAGTSSHRSRAGRLWDKIRGSGLARNAIRGRLDQLSGTQNVQEAIAVTVNIPDGRKITKHVSREDANAIREGRLHFNKAREIDMRGRLFREAKVEGQGG
jgi:hypothetical protein